MLGLMQDEQLSIIRLLDRAGAYYPDQEVVTWTQSGSHRITYAQLSHRVALLGSALTTLGVRSGDRVASLAWNTWRHLELYFAVPAVGAVLLPMNPRFSDEQLIFILRQAGPMVIFTEADWVERVRALVKAASVAVIVVALEDSARAADYGYESLLANSGPILDWPELDERTASSLLYTSGTTGTPKGVLTSHRATVLHCYVISQPCVHGLSASDVVLPVVPMYHAHAWGLPYAAALAGARQVFTGAAGARPEVIARLIEQENVTLAGAVPTVWTSFLAYLRDNSPNLSSLTRIACGGSAVSSELIREYRESVGVSIWQGYGMTETGPQATFAGPQVATPAPSDGDQGEYVRQGIPVPGVRIRVINSDGAEVPRNAVTSGELQLRGLWVASGYYAGAGAESFTRDGWLRTGDIATLDSRGSVKLVDRLKDVIKSGGEWISSLELEEVLVTHPAVNEAVVVAVTDERWGERPVAFISTVPGSTLEMAELEHLLRDRFPAWWLPDRIELVDEVPRTSVGKFDKRKMRELAELTKERDHPQPLS